ncbi:MAG TPA: universal stress protein [Usitatibacter sp.]|jgi:nucleotide-binding universal stress UspA family protein|nr:universal stress protein [Usitatibacter sp.]
MATYSHILVPIDGSRLSAKALRHAARLVKGTRTRLTVIHVIPPFEPAAFVDASAAIPYPDLYSPSEYEKSTRAYAATVLSRAAAAAKKEGAKCETGVLFGAQPWQGIIREAKRRHCDLIAMASHGRRGVAALVLGSETSKVLTHSKIPVLVCR